MENDNENAAVANYMIGLFTGFFMGMLGVTLPNLLTAITRNKFDLNILIIVIVLTALSSGMLIFGKRLIAAICK